MHQRALHQAKPEKNSSYPKQFIFVTQEVDTNRWGRRREWEDTPIRSPAPKVLSRLWEATCQRQTSMRFLRGWMLINFMTKHVNIKGLQIQFSAVMKMPFYWLKGTGLPLWSGHQATAVVLTAQRFITTVQPANPVPRCMRWPSPKDSNPDTCSPSHPRLLWKQTNTQARRELQSYSGFPSVSQTTLPSLSFYSCCCSTAQLEQLQGGCCSLSRDFGSQIFWIHHCLGHQLPVWNVLLTNLVPFKGCRNYKCQDLFQKKGMHTLFYFIFKGRFPLGFQNIRTF